jgi:hypothetical protein
MPRPLRGSTLKLDVQGIADHVIGGVRDEVWRQDLERRPFRTVGSAGDVAVDAASLIRQDHDMVPAPIFVCDDSVIDRRNPGSKGGLGLAEI